MIGNLPFFGGWAGPVTPGGQWRQPVPSALPVPLLLTAAALAFLLPGGLGGSGKLFLVLLGGKQGEGCILGLVHIPKMKDC